MTKPLFLTSCLAAAALATAEPASAQMTSPQPRPERPYRGLFGGGVSAVEQRLVANLSFGGGYDDDLLAESGGAPSTPTTSQSRRGGPFGSAETGLSYNFGVERFTFNANYGMQGRFYRDLPSTFLAGHSVGAGVAIDVTESTKVSGNTSVSYQPFYNAAFLPPVFDPAMGALTLHDPAISYVRRKYFSRTSGLSVSHALTGRTSISGSYSFQSSGVVAEEGYASRSYGASLSHGIGKGLSARAGYYANEAFFVDTGVRRRSRFSSIDAGLDFTKALSLTRKTHLGFSTGTTAATDVSGQARYTFVGDVRLTRELGRTWSAGVSASRSMQFDPVVRDITLTDGVAASINGLINRRLQVQAGVGTSVGSAGFDNPNNGLMSSSASASLHYGISRYLGVGVQYTYYYSSYEAGVDLPFGWPRTLDRQSFSANVNLWAPLMTRTRRPNASR